MTGAQIGVLLNRHRQMLQNETADIGDAITVSVFVLWSFLMEQERAGGFSAAEAMQYLAAEMPGEARKMGLQFA